MISMEEIQRLEAMGHKHTPKRPLDEVYDTMMDVQRDPYGAWQAIQKLSLECSILIKQRDDLASQLKKLASDGEKS